MKRLKLKVLLKYVVFLCLKDLTELLMWSSISVFLHVFYVCVCVCVWAYVCVSVHVLCLYAYSLHKKK